MGIHVTNVDDCKDQLILPFSNDKITSFTPVLSWSPDGKWIAFVGEVVHKKIAEITIIDVENVEWKKLTNGLVSGYLSREINDIKWSPDGTHISFRSTYEKSDDKKRNALFVVEVKTGQEIKLVEQVEYITWSPDSKSIAFIAKKGENKQIYEVETLTHEIVQLTDTSEDKAFLSWK